MKHSFTGILWAAALAAGLTGCGSGLHPVEGHLVWDNDEPAKELDGSMVYFLSSEHRTTSRSLVRDGGRFELTTNRPEARGADGVPPGQHRVYIIDQTPPLVDFRFRDPATSPLEVKVPPDGPVVLKLQRLPAKTARPKSRAIEGVGN